MPDNFALDGILQTIYSAQTLQQTRIVPMQVLAIGISRSGTESLCKALTQLGYGHCSHGWDLMLSPPGQSQSLAWWRLLRRKYRPLPSDPAWSARDFDGLLGHCRAISDLPAAIFAEELMQVYPDAKVILNVRKDLDAWYESFGSTFGPLAENWIIWLAHWFNSELFWIVHTMNHGFLGLFFRDDWRKNAKVVYGEHVAKVRGLGLPKVKFLEWSVEDGWKPLCDFLGKDLPDEAFPSGNTPADFEQRMDAETKRLLKGAMVNLLMTLGAVGAVVVASWYMLPRR